MAAIDQLKAWFERDIRFATWEENVKIDDSDPGQVQLRFYTDTNEYTLTVFADGGAEAQIEATVMARKPRAGQSVARLRRVLPPGPHPLDQRTWRRLLGHVVGLELVRVQRPDPQAGAASPS